MSYRLHNYLRTYRKRAGLSQGEVAFLLGCTNRSKVSRYERFARQPSLETALAYKAIFGISAQELFAGLYEKVEQRTVRRAKMLGAKLGQEKPDNFTPQKMGTLKAIESACQHKRLNQ